ncbi:MAG TPA: hypothetical protein VFA89_04325 [Terriglobales bacterium]|nr:hypothetical protein [Terriglobales bacterium]
MLIGDNVRVLRSILATVFIFGVLALTMCAQESRNEGPRISLPLDWSHRHVIYTGSGSVEDMMAVRSDPRFLQSWFTHRSMQAKFPIAPLPDTQAGADTSEQRAAVDSARWRISGAVPPYRRHQPGVSKSLRSHVDWSVSLGPNGGFAFGEYPAKWSYNILNPPDCLKDFVVFTTIATPGVGKQANLVGFNKLYSGTNPTGLCGTAPNFLFAYAIGTSGSTLSPIVSIDGSKIAWIEGSTPAIFHVTRWVAGQGTNATTGAVAPGAGQDFALSYTTVAASGCNASSNTNGNADAFVDFATDTAFLTAANGILYHVTGVFQGTPTVDFCIPVNTGAGAGMVGPVYDSVHKKVYVSDGRTLYAYTVGTSSFTAAGTITFASKTTFSGPPLVDPLNGYVYVFTTSDTTGKFTTVSQVNLNLTAKTDVHLGPVFKNATAFLFSGDFDNNYYNFGPTNSAATLYSCGTDPAKNTAPALYTINFQATGIINPTPVMAADIKINPGEVNGLCSPLVEFDDGANDRLFIGVGNQSDATGANVVQMWDITNRITSNTTGPTASASPYWGGTTSFAFDNISTASQAESFYFGSLAANGTSTCGNNNYCAVKLTQAGLQ